MLIDFWKVSSTCLLESWLHGMRAEITLQRGSLPKAGKNHPPGSDKGNGSEGGRKGQIAQYILQSSWATVRLHVWQSGLQRWSALRFPVGQDEYEGIQICDHVKFEGPVGHLGRADLQRWPDTERCGHKKMVILERWGHPDGHHQRSVPSGLLYWQCTREECYDILNKTERLASWILLQRLLQSDL